MKARTVALTLLAVLCMSLPASSEPGRPTTTRVSITSEGKEGGISVLGGSGPAAISADGRFVSFASSARLAPEDTNSGRDVFVRDRLNGTTELVSLSSEGFASVLGSYDYYYTWSSISADGRYVAFGSDAPDLVPDDTNDAVDVFVRDRLAATTERVSIGLAGEGNAHSAYPSISGDGRYVAFTSGADNLVPSDTNEHYDIFVRDREGQATERISKSTAGVQGNSDALQPSISADGNRIVFLTDASNLAPKDDPYSLDVFVRDRASATTRLVTPTYMGYPACGFTLSPDISADGNVVSFNCYTSIITVDLRTNASEEVSVSSAGKPANEDSFGSTISGDGRYVAFSSQASNLVADDANQMRDFFVRDRALKKTYLVSVSSTGDQQLTYDGTVLTGFTYPVISDDGRAVAFESFAPNLVLGDTNEAEDVFVWQRPDDCPSGSTELGPISRRLYALETGMLAEPVRDLNCDVVVGAGL